MNRRQLPELSREALARELGMLSDAPLGDRALDALDAHYQELRRWNPKLSLIGPGTVEEVLERHYGEALAALPWIDPGWKEAVDIGSGGGFPGLVLAAACPRLRVTLVEARQRKWAFLSAATRRAALPCRCLNARVIDPLPHGLPEQFDLLTLRAIKLSQGVLDALAERLTPTGRFFFWAGREAPEPPSRLERLGERRLPSGDHRRLVAFGRR